MQAPVFPGPNLLRQIFEAAIAAKFPQVQLDAHGNVIANKPAQPRMSPRGCVRVGKAITYRRGRHYSERTPAGGWVRPQQEVPLYRIDNKAVLAGTSKYKPHQGAAEMRRRAQHRA